MDYNANRKYFQRSIVPLIAGAVVVLVGLAVMYSIRIVGSAFMLLGGAVLMTAGLSLIVFYFFSGMKDAEFDGVTEGTVGQTEKDGEEQVLRADYREKIRKTFTSRGFVFDKSEAKLFRRGRDGKCRSDVFTVSVMYLCPEKLYVFSRTVGMTEEKQEDRFFKLPLEEIKELRIEEARFPFTSGRSAHVAPVCLLRIVSDREEIVFPTQEDALLTEMIDRILKQAKSRREKAETSQEETEKEEK